MSLRTKTLVIGSLGFLGSYFLKAYLKKDPDTFGTQHKFPLHPFYFDLREGSLNHLPIQGRGYTHAIIAAAVSGMSVCENNPEKTAEINVKKTLQLASALSKQGITPILFSTAYVFNGEAGGYHETSLTDPLNVYGAQKAELEKKIEESCGGNYLILRLNKVFSLDFNDQTLFSEMVRKYRDEGVVKAAKDQIFSPIFIDDLIACVQFLQKKGMKGLFNICGREVVSRFELAVYMKRFFKEEVFVKEISLGDLPDEIKRPKRTDLLCHKLFSIPNAPLPKQLPLYMDQIGHQLYQGKQNGCASYCHHA